MALSYNDLYDLAHNNQRVYYYNADVYAFINNVKAFKGFGLDEVTITIGWYTSSVVGGFEKREVKLNDIRIISTIERYLYF